MLGTGLKTGDKTHKVKKLHLIHERFDHINEVFKNARVKDDGNRGFLTLFATSL